MAKSKLRLQPTDPQAPRMENECLRCGHCWNPTPKQRASGRRSPMCGHCHSAYWDTPRRNAPTSKPQVFKPSDYKVEIPLTLTETTIINKGESKSFPNPYPPDAPVRLAVRPLTEGEREAVRALPPPLFARRTI